MQVRCYACGLKLHDGMPTLEELSAPQRAIVLGCEEGSRVHSPSLILDHPHFEGMSLSSFCSECQALVLGLPVRAWAHDIVGHTWTQDSQAGQDFLQHKPSVFRCRCGHPVGTSKDTPAANREWRRHLALILSLDMPA